MSIKVISPGMLTTVQDSGRFGFQKFGFSPNGVMDLQSYHIANALVENFSDEAVLEMTMLGGKFYFTDPAIIAVTGADMAAEIDGAPIEMYKNIYVNRESTLTFKTAKSGVRTYLAVAGGFNINEKMGSRSTNIKCKVGGFNGRKLAAGDVLELRRYASEFPHMQQHSVVQQTFSSDTVTLRVVLGPQEDYFTEKGINTFLNSEYMVTANSDRMGYKLEGEKIEALDKSDIISDGIAPGSVQVPSSGQPIIMLADRQTTGGYAKIATVISSDLSMLVQAKPGDKIHFAVISRKQAEKIYRHQQKMIEKLLISL